MDTFRLLALISGLEDSKEPSDSLLPTHENIRGRHYYH